MEKLNIGQRFVLEKDREVTSDLTETAYIFKKGTVFFADVDRRFWCTLNGKMLLIDQDSFEIVDGYSVTGLAEWIYQRISATWPIDEMLEEAADDEETGFPDQVKAFKESIGEALEELGFYDSTGNTL